MDALPRWSRHPFPPSATAPECSDQQALLRAVEHPDPRSLARLLRRGVRPDEDARPGHSVLPRAAFKCHTEHVRLLLEHGARTNRIDAFGMTAMQWAAWCGCLTIIRLLAHASASINDHCDPTSSPLTLAAQEGHLDCVRTLLALGANPCLVGSSTGEPFDLPAFVLDAGQPEAAELIQAHIRKTRTSSCCCSGAESLPHVSL